jgi:hypothetical protein
MKPRLSVVIVCREAVGLVPGDVYSLFIRNFSDVGEQDFKYFNLSTDRSIHDSYSRL